MTKHWLYLRYVLRHKYFVFVAGRKLDVPLHRLILHDWTKFLPREWFPYTEYFYGEKVAHPTKQIIADEGFTPLMIVPPEVADAFDVAWNYHQKRNDHHWQFWLLTPDNPRPNFNQQSHDGGMSHVTFSGLTEFAGRDAAVAWYSGSDWWKPDWKAIEAMDADLRHVTVALPMSKVARAEMLADWHGAGRALGKPDTRAWYLANRNNMKLHPETRQFIEVMLKVEEPRLVNSVEASCEDTKTA